MTRQGRDAGDGGGPPAVPEELAPARRIYAGAVFSVWQQRLRFPGGSERRYDVVRHPGAVAVAAVTPAGELVLVRQHRPPAGEILWELPAGTVEAGEDAAACARRELREETGLTAPSLRHLLSFYTTPGFCDERMDLFYAADATPHPDGADPDPTESLEVRLLPCARALALARAGELRDAKTLVGIWALAQLGLAPGGSLADG